MHLLVILPASWPTCRDAFFLFGIAARVRWLCKKLDGHACIFQLFHARICIRWSASNFPSFSCHDACLRTSRTYQYVKSLFGPSEIRSSMPPLSLLLQLRIHTSLNRPKHVNGSSAECFQLSFVFECSKKTAETNTHRNRRRHSLGILTFFWICIQNQQRAKIFLAAAKKCKDVPRIWGYFFFAAFFFARKTSYQYQDQQRYYPCCSS